MTWLDGARATAVLLLEKWPEFVVTFLGVLGGALLAWRIELGAARWQVNEERRVAAARDEEQLVGLLDRVKFEIRDNEGWVKRLTRLFEMATPTNASGRRDLLTWATALVPALSIAAYDDLARSGLHRILPTDIQADLFDARQRTVGLRAMVDSALSAFEYYIRFGTGKTGDESVETVVQNLLTYSTTTQETLTRTKEAAFGASAALRQTGADRQNARPGRGPGRP